MNQYSPLIFKNPDKRTDLPDVMKDELDTKEVKIDLEAVKKVKKIRGEINV